MKTNATRILDSMGIRYQLVEYAVDPNDLSAETVARKVGLPPEQVFKTLVVRGDRGGVCLAVIPGNQELDGKALARLTGDRHVEVAALKDVTTLTGYIRGGDGTGGEARVPSVGRRDHRAVRRDCGVGRGARDAGAAVAGGLSKGDEGRDWGDRAGEARVELRVICAAGR
jgi:Cys-tRNA(Pro) deacylase